MNLLNRDWFYCFLGLLSMQQGKAWAHPSSWMSSAHFRARQEKDTTHPFRWGCRRSNSKPNWEPVMFSFAYISEHINGIKENLFTMKQILALFYLIAPLPTPVWLLWPGPSRALPRGWLWAVAGPGSAQSLLAQPPCPWWPAHLGCAAHSALQPCRGNKCTWNQVSKPLGKSQNQPCVCHRSAPAHEHPQHLRLINCSRLYTNSWGDSSVTGKLANHFQKTRHVCFSRLKQEASALNLLPVLSGNFKAEQSPLPRVLYLKRWKGEDRRCFPGSL